MTDREIWDKANKYSFTVATVYKLLKQIEKMKNCENCIKTRKAKCDDNLRVLAKINRTCNKWELAE